MPRSTIAGAFLGLVLASCSGGGGGGEVDPTRFTIQGTLGADFARASPRRAGQRAGEMGAPGVDLVLAVPLVNQDLSLRDAVEFPIPADGTISADLDRSYDWVLLLLDTTAVPEERFVAYVTMGAGDQAMMAFPVSATDPTTGALDLGVLTPNGHDAKGTTTAADVPDTFTLSLESLQTIARSDDAFRLIVNDYLNSGEVYFRARPGISYTTHHAEVAAAPDDYAYDGFLVDVRTDDTTRLDFAALCAGTQVATFHPPVEVTTGAGHVFGPGAPLSTAGATPVGEDYCIGPHINFALTQLADGPELGFGMMAGGDVGLMPLPAAAPGWWRMRVDGTELALFDLAVADPVVEGRPTVPVPGFTVTTDADGVITAFEIDFYQWDAAATGYEPVADRAAVARLISSNFLGLRGGSGGLEELIYAPGGTLLEATVTPQDRWSAAEGTPAAGAERIDNIDIGLVIGGQTFHFIWLRI